MTRTAATPSSRDSSPRRLSKASRGDMRRIRKSAGSEAISEPKAAAALSSMRFRLDIGSQGESRFGRHSPVSKPHSRQPSRSCHVLLSASSYTERANSR